MIGKTKEETDMDKILESCTLCPRHCKVNREAGKRGYCSVDAGIVVARAALHMWEEPCISGKKGSGAVFFCGCSLHCIFCQNHEISAGRGGQVISAERLAEIFLELEAQGAANINLVTAAQYVPQTVQALLRAKDQGLHIPVVYNSGGYESVETLKRLDGLVDIYLPDLKYMETDLAAKFSHAADYPQIAKEAIREMVRQSGPCVFGEDGYLKRGTIVRHLLMPGHTRNSKAVLAYLHETYGDTIYISIMNQYTPVQEQTEYPELNRKVTRREYEKVLAYALDLGIKNGFFQEGETAAESFIPQFDCEGVAPKTP
jgi:putative pyruvate formate lyase activating enzyme